MMSEIQPRFFTFLHCTLDDKWESVPINDLPAEKQWITERMARFRARSVGATITIVDASYRELSLQFNRMSFVGAGNGIIYCEKRDLIDRSIKGASADLYNISM
jgi:hypothetical protein